MPSVSIIIPAYNAAKTIDRCLQSVFRQSFKDFEVLAVNDGSTDATAEKLLAYQGRVTVISQPNAGAAAARNAGAKRATGTYLLFCDADIVLEPNALEQLTSALEDTPHAAYAYSSFWYGHKRFALGPFDPDRLRRMPYIHTTSLLRRTDFPGFDPALKRFQDWDLWLTLLKAGKIGVFVPHYLFQVFPGGTMSSWFPKFFLRLPGFRMLPNVSAYRKAETIIREKHQLPNA